MKKILMGFVVAVVAVAAGAYFYLGQDKGSDTIYPENILPEKTMALIQIKDLEDGIESIKSSKLGTSVQKINLKDTIDQLEIPVDKLKGFEEFKTQVNSEINKKAFFNFFGKDFSIALMDFDALSSENSSQNPMPGGALICRTKLDEKLSAALLKKALPEVKELGSFTYEGVKVSQLAYEKMEFFNFVEQGYLIAATTEASAKAIIDASKKGKNLAQSQRFTKVVKDVQRKKSSLFCFFDAETTYEQVGKISHAINTKELEKFRRSLTYDIGSLAYCGYKASGEKFALETVIDMKEKVNLPAEDPDKFASRVPAESIAFTWQNNFDLERIMKSIFTEDHQLKSFENRLLFETGLDPKDLYKSFSGELGFILTEIDTKGMFPIPSIAIVLNKDAGKPFEQYINMLAGKPRSKISILDKEIGGSKVNYIPVPLGESVSPCWTYMDNNFVVAINTNLVSKMQQAKDTGDNITKDSVYKFVNEGLAEKCNAITFMNNRKFFESLGDVGNSLLNFAAMQGPEYTEKGSILLKEVVTPFLEGLSMYEATGGRSYFEGNKIVGKGCIKINNN